MICIYMERCVSKEPCATAPPYFTNNSGSGCGDKIRKRRRRKNGGGGRVVPTREPTILLTPTMSPTMSPTASPTTYLTLPIVPTMSPTASPTASPTVGIEPAPSMGTKLVAALLVLFFTLILGLVW